MSEQDALAFIDEAIEALSLECYRAADVPGEDLEWQSVPELESTLAIELERIDTALGRCGESMFYPIAQSIRQAMIALHGAQNALRDQN